MVVNNRERSVMYLDPLKRYSYMEGLLTALVKYLKAELSHHLHKKIENSAWSDVFYRENQEKGRFSQAESSLYVLKHATLISQGFDRPLTSADLENESEAVFRAVALEGLN